MKKLLAITIILSVLLSMGILQAPAFASTSDSEIIYYFNDFSEGSAYINNKPGEDVNSPSNDLPECYTKTDDTIYTSLETATDSVGNESILRVTTDGNGKIYNWNFPSVTPQGKPDIVVEFRLRADLSAGRYMRSETDVFCQRLNGSRNVDIRPDGIYIDSSASQSLASSSTWNTVSIVYKASEGTRDVYINGEYKASATNSASSAYENNYYTTGMFGLYSTVYLNSGNYVDIDYLKIYKKPSNLQFEVIESESTEINYIDIKLSSPLKELTASKISVAGETPVDVECISLSENIYRITLGSSLECDTEYSVTLSDIEDYFGNTIASETKNFKTRKSIFYIEDMTLSSGNTEPTGLGAGDYKVSANAVNELESSETVTFIGASYNSDGTLIKTSGNILSEDVTITTGTNGKVDTQNNLTVPSAASETRTFAWKSANIPVPVSGYTSYETYSVTKEKISHKTPEYTGTPELKVEIKNDYSGAIITVKTGDTKNERMVGILVKRESDVEYMITEKTANGELVIDLPLVDGEYSVTAGIEKGGIVTLESPLEYYSPSYISSSLESKINNKLTATTVTAGEFVDELGSYLGFDMAELAKLSDASKAYEYLFILRDEPEGDVNDNFADTEELKTAIAVAVKLAKIYEGKDTALILENSSEFNVETKVKNTIKEDMSATAKAYMADELKANIYNPITDLGADARTYAILCGVHGADSYKQVRSIIEDYGDELGINMTDYTDLENPKAVEDKIIHNEYASLILFKEAVNAEITIAKEAEENPVDPPVVTPPPVYIGGGGGGGGSRIDFTTEEKENDDKTSETKEEALKISYTDVKENDWFYNDVSWATNKKLFIGTDTGAFLPQRNLTWEHITIVLKRMGHTVNNQHGKADITRGEFAELIYELLADKTISKDAYEWVKNNGIFIGDANGDMFFEKTLTRAQCCTVLRRIDK